MLREEIAPIAPIVTTIVAAFLARAAWKQANTAWAQARTARRRHEEQTKADLERRFTESFAKAVEQLGSEKLATRLGGIYALEDISRESERKYWPIMETLTAFVRERAPCLPRHSDGPADQEKKPESADKRTRPATDVQAVLTVLRRRNKKMRDQEGKKDQHLDLSATDLRGAGLGKAHLKGALLSRANLEGAWLVGARLEDARLEEACLKHVELWNVHLEGADFFKAQLEGADFAGVHLKGDSKRANFQAANLEGAKNLTQEQIDSAIGDENTILPEGLERPAHWIKR